MSADRNATTQTVAAVDGGKSALRLLIDSPAGRWTGVAEGFTYQPGIDDVAVMSDAVALARASAGHSGHVDRVCAGLTAAPAAPEPRQRLARALALIFGGADVLLVDDGLMAHAGALGAPGVVICAGTGAVAIAVNHDGHQVRADGWGYLLGDRGSGFAIGRAGLSAALAAVDGTGPSTTLTEAASAHLGRLDIAAVQRLLREDAIPRRVASFAITISHAAAAGDAVAQSILRHAGADLARTAAAAARNAGLSPGAAVSYSGRLFHAGEPLLRGVREELARLDLNLVPPEADALAGGLRLAQHPGQPPYQGLVETPIRHD